MIQADLLILNAQELLTLSAGNLPRRGSDMRELSILQDGGLAIRNGNILAVGKSPDIFSRYQADQILDARGCVVSPGLVDPHTHLVFAGSREDEYQLRVAGKSYMEIAAAGGGILSSVKKFRAASADDLYGQSLARLQHFLEHGATTVEIKSGYGLSLEDERKALRVAKRLNEEHSADVVCTFLGAHEIPAEYRKNREEYIRLLYEEMIPSIYDEGLAEYCDIFCEKGVFSVEESRRILKRAADCGFKLKLHADEIESTGGAELAVELGAGSADHLMAVSDDGIRALAGSNTVAVLLPATSFHLGMLRYAPARKLIDAGCAVALSTDCNPGSSMTENPQFLFNLASSYLKMPSAEIWSALTVNAACAIGRGGRIGRLAPGLQADVVIWNMPNHNIPPYHIGRNFVKTVIKNGKVVINR